MPREISWGKQSHGDDTFLASFPGTKEGYEEGARELNKMAQKLAAQGLSKKYGVFLEKTRVGFDKPCWMLYLRDRSQSKDS